MNTADLMKLITDGWPFDENSYPALATITDPAKRLQFCVDHIMKHLAKNYGAFAGASESDDHGYTNLRTNEIDLKGTAIKMVQNTLRLASLLDISPEDLEKTIQKSFEGVRFTAFEDSRTGEVLHRPRKGL